MKKRNGAPRHFDLRRCFGFAGPVLVGTISEEYLACDSQAWRKSKRGLGGGARSS